MSKFVRFLVSLALLLSFQFVSYSQWIDGSGYKYIKRFEGNKIFKINDSFEKEYIFFHDGSIIFKLDINSGVSTEYANPMISRTIIDFDIDKNEDFLYILTDSALYEYDLKYKSISNDILNVPFNKTNLTIRLFDSLLYVGPNREVMNDPHNPNDYVTQIFSIKPLIESKPIKGIIHSICNDRDKMVLESRMSEVVTNPRNSAGKTHYYYYHFFDSDIDTQIVYRNYVYVGYKQMQYIVRTEFSKSKQIDYINRDQAYLFANGNLFVTSKLENWIQFYTPGSYERKPFVEDSFRISSNIDRFAIDKSEKYVASINYQDSKIYLSSLEENVLFDSLELNQYAIDIFPTNNELEFLVKCDSSLVKVNFNKDSGVISKSVNISVVPNPVTNQLNCVFDNLSNGYLQVHIFDSRGNKIKDVFEGETSSQYFEKNIDVTSLHPGQYFIVARNNGSYKSKLFIKIE